MIRILLAVGLLALGFPSSSSYEDCVQIKKPPGVDDEFLTKTKTWHVPLQSKCVNCETKQEQWASFSGRKAPKELCYTMHGTNDGKEFSAQFQCKYNSPNKGDCLMAGTKPPHLAGSLTVTKTDNKTYIAGAMCIYGKENFWYVISIHEKLDKKAKKAILADFKERGFEDDSVATDENTKLRFKQFSITKSCKGGKDEGKEEEEDDE